MHALGFWHEQQRDDRDEHIKFWPERCSWSEGAINANFGKLGAKWNGLGSAYDIASVLHYPTWACRKSGHDRPMTNLDGSPLILQATSSLSKGDIEQINQLYNCGIRTSTQAPPTPTTKPAYGGKMNLFLGYLGAPDSGVRPISHCVAWCSVTGICSIKYAICHIYNIFH